MTATPTTTEVVDRVNAIAMHSVCQWILDNEVRGVESIDAAPIAGPGAITILIRNPAADDAADKIHVDEHCDWTSSTGRRTRTWDGRLDDGTRVLLRSAELTAAWWDR